MNGIKEALEIYYDCEEWSAQAMDSCTPGEAHWFKFAKPITGVQFMDEISKLKDYIESETSLSFEYVASSVGGFRTTSVGARTSEDYSRVKEVKGGWMRVNPA